MKINLTYIPIVLLVVVLLCSGCDKWLDVQPKDQVNDEQLFSDAMGFRNALNGIYQKAAVPELYGRSLTWGFNSFLAQEYGFTGGGSNLQGLLQAGQFNFTDYRVTPVISGIWSHAYNTIANCNKLIGEIETRDPGIFPLGQTEKDLILGEALAMRGLLHFELLRLFAPAPGRDMTGAYIPYQDGYPTYYIPPVSTREVLDHVIADLSEAKNLVAKNDTVVNVAGISAFYSMITGSVALEGGMFFSFRMSRLNMAAIQGLLARVYLYAGDRASARREAEFLYSVYGPHGSRKYWTFTSQANTQGTELYPKLANDLLFALYDKELISKINDFRVGTAMAMTTAVSEWLPASVRDYRANLIKADRTSAKWIESTSSAQYVREQNLLIPVIRMSEMYYILSECLYEEGDFQGALQVLNQVRQGRGRTDTFTNTDRGAFYNELLMEYRREYLLEGQTVFAHKRLSRPMQIGTRIIEMDNSRFVLPVPEGETIF